MSMFTRLDVMRAIAEKAVRIQERGRANAEATISPSIPPNMILHVLDLADLVRSDIAAGRCWPEAEAALAALNQEATT